MPERKERSNNSGWERAELNLLSSSFISLTKSCSPVLSQIPEVSVPTRPPASVIRYTKGADCTVSYNNMPLLNEFVAEMCTNDDINAVGPLLFSLAEKNIFLQRKIDL